MAMAYSMPSFSGPCKVLEFDKEKCVGCNLCVNACPLDVMIPNPEKGQEPIVIYAEECWFCGGCVQECPRGAVKLIAPAKQRISTIFKRKDTGEEFRVGQVNPMEPNTTPPVSERSTR